MKIRSISLYQDIFKTMANIKETITYFSNKVLGGKGMDVLHEQRQDLL